MKKYFKDSANTMINFIEEYEDELKKTINKIVECIKKGNKLIICGNGGSAADSQHFAAELVGRFKLERNGYPAISLTTDTSIITAIGNDYGFDKIFERQLEAIGEEGDVLIGISTSGNSENIINAVKLSKKMGVYTIGLLGKGGGKLKDLVDIPLVVPSNDTPHIQECHVCIYHVICEEVEKILVDNNDNKR